jgi:hypothetical protein
MMVSTSKSYFFLKNIGGFEVSALFFGKIVIFHTKYPNNFRASLRNWKNDFFGVKS